jgi:hypothetical protein
MWLPGVFGRRVRLNSPVCSAALSRLLGCCALPPQVIRGMTNQPNHEKYRGKH